MCLWARRPCSTTALLDTKSHKAVVGSGCLRAKVENHTKGTSCMQCERHDAFMVKQFATMIKTETVSL